MSYYLIAILDLLVQLGDLVPQLLQLRIVVVEARARLPTPWASAVEFRLLVVAKNDEPLLRVVLVSHDHLQVS